MQLIETLYKISDLYLKIDNLDLSKQYLGQALYIQQNYLLQQQSIYANTYQKLKSAKPEALVLHPGPINRGVELENKLADDLNKSVITEQVEKGVAVRMACLSIMVK